MNRFYSISILLHLAFLSALVLMSRKNLHVVPKFEVYKVSIAPLPQPKIIEIKKPKEQEVKEGERIKEKAPPKKKIVSKKAQEIEKKSKEAIKKGLPDITPKVYTGSGRGFTYSYYLNILLGKIQKNWHNPFKNKDIILKSIVYFEVDKKGTIYNIRLEESSGNEVYNETTIRAVTLTRKLPPLPQEFSDDYLKVHLEFLTAR